MRIALLSGNRLSLPVAASANVILFVLLALFQLQLAHAESRSLDQVNLASSDDTPTAVSPPKRPTEITVGAYLIGLSRVSPPSEAFPSFEVEMFVDLSWRDHRLAFASPTGQPMVFLEEEAEEKLSEIWSPDIEIQHEVEQRTTDSIELMIFPDGTVQYEESFGAVVNARLDLRRFPFDKQTFDLEIQSFVWDQNELKLIVNEQLLGMDTDFYTPEWTVTGIEALLSQRSEIRDENAFSTFTFRIHATRHGGHYLLRILMPLMFVMVLAWSLLWADPIDRVRIGFIALLTVVATHTVISRSLPRLHYPTFSDILLTICYFYAAVLVVESIWVNRVALKSTERASEIDRKMRWILPLGTSVVLVISILILWI
ncbi:MAG: hypothetical protein HKP12_12355 [Gammaproteobacteria bacterium]|nr:hypothetical protein [Gammaproteobacteria bacterium]